MPSNFKIQKGGGGGGKEKKITRISRLALRNNEPCFAASISASNTRAHLPPINSD